MITLGINAHILLQGQVGNDGVNELSCGTFYQQLPLVIIMDSLLYTYAAFMDNLHSWTILFSPFRLYHPPIRISMILLAIDALSPLLLHSIYVSNRPDVLQAAWNKIVS